MPLSVRRGAQPAGGSAFTPEDLKLLKKLLRWPAAQLFPGLDLARLVVLQPAGQASLAAEAGPIEVSPLGRLAGSHCWQTLCAAAAWGVSDSEWEQAKHAPQPKGSAENAPDTKSLLAAAALAGLL